jgi:hypothetical protein
MQAAHGIADRRTADPEFCSQVGLDQTRVSGQLVVQDAAAQRATYRFWK